MRILLCLTLLGTACSTPLKTETAIAPTNEELSALYVLPGESKPTFYDVQLFIDPEYVNNFNGTVTMRVIPNIDTTAITLHAMDMIIESIKVTAELNSASDLFANFTLADDDTHLLRIQTRLTMISGRPYEVTIKYTAHYAENMFGVYITSHQEEGNTINVVTSQLQPTFARRTFPCYDEPALKAVFRTTIYTRSSYNVVESNMPLRPATDQLKPEIDTWKKHEFQDTLVMSSYLNAYLVSNFNSIDNTNNPQYRIPLKVYSRPGTQNAAAFALDFGQKNMAALEEYTQFPYYFPKLDKVAVPDFAAGAMENWGLVIYREEGLLVQEGKTTLSTRQYIGSIISHENAHQWFGNEASPQSWTYTWLNEGFANFFESFATDLVLPEWRMMDQFLLNLQNVFQSDAVLTVNPMTYDVFTPSQIQSTFNSVAYQKSGAVIRMMQHFLTPEVFRQGLNIFIRNRSRKAATPADLYAALQEALNSSNHTIAYPLATIMQSWTTFRGFPVITVKRNAPTANSVNIAQERYLTDNTLSSTERWHVPFNWVISTNADFSSTSPQGWLPRSAAVTPVDIPGLADADWFIFNKQQTGYYRVNYDDENWQALARVLSDSHETIHLLNRAQLIDDSFNLARNGRLSYTYAFELSRYLEKEADYIPWASANAAFTFLRTVLSESSAYKYYENYLLTLTKPLYERLGFNVIPGEEHVTPFHRNVILNINCRHGNQDCIDNAERLLQAFRQNPSQSLNPDIQSTVYCSGLRGGDADNFNFLWDQYLASQDLSEQSLLLGALGCTSNTGRRDFYLNQVIAPDSPVREQDRHRIIISVVNSSPVNTNAALDFILEHFSTIKANLQGLSSSTQLLNAFGRSLTSQEHADKIEEFSNRYQNEFTPGDLAEVAAIKENIAAAITWNRNNLATVEAWLNTNYGSSNNAPALSASLALLLSLCVFLNTLL